MPSRPSLLSRAPLSRPVLTLAAALGLVVAVGGPALASVSAAPTLPCAQPDGRVSAMTISNGTVYIGGSFKRVKDRSGTWQTRKGLAAVNASTCDLTGWTADVDGDVNALVASGSTIYAGGEFTHIGGQARARLAGLNASTAAVTGFSHTIAKDVNALAVSGSRLYAGGKFTAVDGTSRPKLAAFSLASGALDGGWRPSANGAVEALNVGGSGTVYVGGSFSSLNGGDANLGAVDPASGATDSRFRPRPSFPILRLTSDSRGVYAGGAGSGGHAAVYNLDGSLQRPVYQTDGDVQAVAVDGDSFWVGGHFVNYCAGNTGSGAPYQCTVNVERRKLFEVKLSSGQVTSWSPTLDSPFGAFVAEVDPATHHLWVGGDFTHVGSQSVQHLVRFD